MVGVAKWRHCTTVFWVVFLIGWIHSRFQSFDPFGQRRGSIPAADQKDRSSGNENGLNQIFRYNNEVCKTVRLTTFQNHIWNLFQSSWSIRSFFCICCVIYTFFSCLEQFLLQLARFNGGSCGLNFDNFRDTAFLISWKVLIMTTDIRTWALPGLSYQVN